MQLQLSFFQFELYRIQMYRIDENNSQIESKYTQFELYIYEYIYIYISERLDESLIISMHL